MVKKNKTIALSEETYILLLDFKERTKSRTMDEAVRKLVELSRYAMIFEVLEYINRKKLREEEVRFLEQLRKKLREEGVWLRKL